MMRTSKALGLYIHIPYCSRKCGYCDFLSFGGKDEASHREYINALIKEIEYNGKVYHNKYYVDTIFIGGGTPSFINAALIAEIMTAIRAHFLVSENAEITIETNPGTITEEKLKTYLETGINRLSMGVQSLDNELLRLMGRIHSAEEATENFLLARSCGFDNINLDIMFALPGQTMEQWIKTLQRALSLFPQHISFYSLQYEEGTPFFSRLMEGTLEEASDELYVEMYHEAISMLEAEGFNHYEISNAAKPGYSCKHNLKYWSLEDYLGLGLGSHSYMGGLRFSNTKDMDSYVTAGATVGKRIASSDAPENENPFVAWQHKNTRQDDISEYIFTGLRKKQGIALKDFEEKFGQGILSLYDNEIQESVDKELLEIWDGWLRFTPKGIHLSNSVLADFV